MIISHGFVFLLVTLYGTLAQDRCTSPRNKPGVCINIYNCDAAIEILQKQEPVSTATQNYLNSLKCGFEGTNPKVCCELQVQSSVLRQRRHPLRRLESIHFHPEFSNSKMQGDIALIRLNADADFRSNNVRPICLPIGSAATMTREKVTVTGWSLMEHKVRSDKLLKVQLDLINTEDCTRAYNGRVQIWHKQICAGGKRGIDACGGDSGGPLQAPALYRNNIKFIQYGIVSFGVKECGTAGVPGVYTNVVHYMDWILNTIRP